MLKGLGNCVQTVTILLSSIQHVDKNEIAVGTLFVNPT
jgi:hypothetical protein